MTVNQQCSTVPLAAAREGPFLSLFLLFGFIWLALCVGVMKQQILSGAVDSTSRK